MTIARFVHNTIQGDLDCDGQGDACDDDRDGDGYSDADEIIDYGTSPTKADSDGDGISDGPLVPECPDTCWPPVPTRRRWARSRRPRFLRHGCSGR